MIEQNEIIKFNYAIDCTGIKVHNSDLPDVDLDSDSKQRIMDYLRKTYGQNNVCLIGNRTNFTAANLLQDLGRVYDIEQSQILQVTKQFSDLSKEDKENLTSFSTEQLKIKFHFMKNLFEKYPQIEMPFNELRGLCVSYGVHASGILVKDKNGLDLIDMLPVRMSKDGVSTCWMEGHQGRQLGNMGFIKMDMLQVKAMNFINAMINMVNKRYNYDRDLIEYTQQGYLNDKQNFKIANKGDLLGVWQLDSKVANGVIRDMGGISNFNQISAVNALMRPASLQNKFPKKFGDRKKGEQDYYIPQCAKTVLSKTFGLPIFQQAAMQLGIKLAGFDIVTAYKYMKLLYKQKMTKDLIPIWKEKFLTGCQPKVDSGQLKKGYPEQIFNELLSFAGYGFNECLDIHSKVQLQNGTFKQLKDVVIGDIIKSANKFYNHNIKIDYNNIIYVKVKNIFHNHKDLYQIQLSDGKKVISSLNHKYKVMRNTDGVNNYYMKPLCDILDMIEPNNFERDINEQEYHIITQDGICDIINYKCVGNGQTIDLQVDHEQHQFFANGILVSNSHSVAYSMYSAIDLFFKSHYPKEFICCLLNQYSRTEEIQGISAIKYLLNYARKNGIRVFKPDINRSLNEWIIDSNGLLQGLLFPLRDMMLLNTIDINNILNNRPYNNFEDFYLKVGNKLNDKKFEHLICSQAFNEFGDVSTILIEWNRLKNRKDSDQLDMFADFNDQVASSTPILSYNQQKTSQQEMLNYKFQPLLTDRYEKYIEQYNHKAKQNNLTRLKTLGQIDESNVKFTLIIAKVNKIAFFNPKNGGVTKCWVFLTDGIYNGKILLSKQDVQNTYSNYFKENNVLQIPVTVSDNDRMTFFFNKNSEKAELKILHQQR